MYSHTRQAESSRRKNRSKFFRNLCPNNSNNNSLCLSNNNSNSNSNSISSSLVSTRANLALMEDMCSQPMEPLSNLVSGTRIQTLLALVSHNSLSPERGILITLCLDSLDNLDKPNQVLLIPVLNNPVRISLLKANGIPVPLSHNRGTPTHLALVSHNNLNLVHGTLIIHNLHSNSLNQVSGIPTPPNRVSGARAMASRRITTTHLPKASELLYFYKLN